MIDCCLYAQPASQAELFQFLSAGWRDYLTPARAEGRPRALPNILPKRFHRDPEGERLAGDRPPQAGLGSLVEGTGAEFALVVPEPGLQVAVLPHHGFALGLASAINGWALSRLEEAGDRRLRTLITAAVQVPEAAAGEIRRLGSDDRFAGVLLGGNGLGKPFGHPAYEPVLRAAAELDLPVVVHVHSEASPNTLTHPTAAGLPSTYVEYEILRAHAVMTHLTSLIGQGVFDRFPGLRVLALGAGVTWLTSWVWRFDAEHRGLGVSEAPWLRTIPSRYLRENVGVSTYSLNGGGLLPQEVRALRQLEGAEEIICYGSGLPAWDASPPGTLDAWLPAEWRSRVLSDNARRLLRLPAHMEAR